MKRHVLVALPVAAACALFGCRQPVDARRVSEPADAGTGQAPRFPASQETAQARAIEVLGGYSVRLPAQDRTCWNGSVAGTVVECVTREIAVQSLQGRDARPAVAPTPADACPSLFVALRGGRSPMEASPFPGLFDARATTDARPKDPGACCYRVEGDCPDSPSENVR
jgi:hypothetical protein